MSESISTRGSKRSEKSTCRKCNRTILVLPGTDGTRFEVDPELLNVYPFEGGTGFVFARRAHADNCERYVLEASKAKLKAELRTYNTKNGRRGSGPGL